MDNVTITQVEPQPHYKGPYPARFTLHFAISSTGPAEVKYIIVNQAGVSWEAGTLHFDKAGVQTVSWPFKVGIPGQLWQGWAKVEVYSPNHVESIEARLSVDCRP